MDLRYVLGLDIGIASVGWAVLALDDNDEPYKIEALNSRIFEKAENPKDGSSLAAPRREARSMRRRLRRRRHRSERVYGGSRVLVFLRHSEKCHAWQRTARSALRRAGQETFTCGVEQSVALLCKAQRLQVQSKE